MAFHLFDIQTRCQAIDLTAALSAHRLTNFSETLPTNGFY